MVGAVVLGQAVGRVGRADCRLVQGARRAALGLQLAGFGQIGRWRQDNPGLVHVQVLGRRQAGVGLE